MNGFSLEVVTQRGVVLSERGVESLVVRRDDDGSPGCEVAVLRGHAPMLARTAACELRWVAGGRSHHRPIGPGVLEVFEERVTLVLSEEPPKATA